jgi:hypothetical protein
VTGFYIPGIAQPSSSSGGQTGLFVVASNDPAAGPTFVPNSATSALVATSQQTSLSPLSEVPYTAVYSNVGGDSKVHLYALPLSNSALTATPMQISSLSVASASDICHTNSAQTNIDQPNTLFILVQTAGADGTCGTTDDVFEVVHYSDSASTAPTVVTVPAYLFTALYQPGGALGGLVMLNSTTSTLQFYTSDAFTSPSTLVSGVTAVSAGTLNQTGISNATNFFGLTISGVQHLYGISSSGVATGLYTANGTLLFGVNDEANLYFIDKVSNPATESFLQVALGGGTPTVLYDATYATGQTDALVGSNGTTLVYESNLPSTTQTLSTLPVGTHSNTAGALASFTGNAVSATMLSPSNTVGGADSVVFANVTTTSGQTISFSSEALKPNGTVIVPLTANSQFLQPVAPGTNEIFQARSGEIYPVNMTTGVAGAAYTTTGGGAFTVPANSELIDMLGITPSIGIGGYISSGGGPTAGLVFNSTTSVIVPVTVPNSPSLLLL